jgi:CheY-like chemotaxis protein
MSRKRILVADDNTIIRKMLCEMFAHHATLEICDEAVNGAEAVEMAAKVRPDLVILDLSMPVMNGIEAAARISKMHPGVPIILFTQHTEKFYAMLGLAPGIRRVVSKEKAHTLVGHAEELATA